MPDIQIQQLNWLPLRSKALFFVPKMLRLVVRESVGQGEIVEASKKLEERFWLGPPAVRTMFACGPVTAVKAESGVKALDLILTERGKKALIGGEDIIACVLKMRGVKEVTAELKSDDAALGRAVGLSPGFVENARRGGRVTLAGGVRLIDSIATQISARGLKLERTHPVSELLELYTRRAYAEILSSDWLGFKGIYKQSGRDEVWLVGFSDLSIEISLPGLYQRVW